MQWAEIAGYMGALLTIVTYSVRTMIPLRVVGLCANCFFIIYGFFDHVYPSLFLHAILLPLNVLRLYQMMQLAEKVRIASRGDLNMDWLKPYMSNRSCKSGEIIFNRGDLSSAMFYTVSGKLRLKEISADIGPGELVGEIGLIAPDNKRTLSFECVEEGNLLTRRKVGAAGRRRHGGGDPAQRCLTGHRESLEEAPGARRPISAARCRALRTSG